jgi:hypothetical protein
VTTLRVPREGERVWIDGEWFYVARVMPPGTCWLFHDGKFSRVIDYREIPDDLSNVMEQTYHDQNNERGNSDGEQADG